MKRGPKPSNGAGATSGNATLVKSTYMLQSTLKQNLAYLALERGLDQSDIVRTALEDYLKKEKIDPTKPPKVSFRSPD